MVCKRCNNEFDSRKYRCSDGSTQCPECGAVYYGEPRSEGTGNETRPNNGLTCPHCGSNNISVQFIQDSANTLGVSSSVKVDGGCLWNLIYYCCGLFLIKWLWKLCTFWLPSVKLGRKSVKASHTRIQNQKMAVCNRCGHNWELS